ncbi:o-succinylbenzoate--CoA ligase [Neobacillus massiliamazoniensis]|uniref:AMP-dependent synthetase and ligase n=1 Tax=Neobacillus massiliamazoniensis TaxID=1499688 RepID=A0A0U1P4B3_9BACI|nr:o-succinylbenzoate--CoA ligase [Neobacillus massiliamazoniensis]CRK85107.1 AMP-dependent synthetase and ligase [Neobacillus massiliamazoniensis]
MVKGIGNWFVKHSKARPDRLAFVYNEKRYTYVEVNERVNRLANTLLTKGVRKGDRVNALLFNTNEMLESMFACAKIGAIFVPINFRLSVDEVLYIVNDSRAYHFIYDCRMKSLVEQLRDMKSSLQEYIHVGNNPHKEDSVYEDLIANASNKEPEYDIRLEDVQMMMYTSGTTGRPKGAMLTHGNTQWNAINSINIIPFDYSDSTLAVAPLFHIGGMSVITSPLLYKGGTVFLEDHFDPTRVLQKIHDERITSIFLVPAMWQALTNVENFGAYDISSLRIAISGGAPCPITVIEFFQKRDIPFYEGFGLTETAPSVCILDRENSVRKNGSVGRELIHTSVRIVDPNDRDVPTGEVGEMIVNGPNVMAGYWNKPEATKESIKNGWFYTGDLAKFDVEGFIYIVDRKKDMIITGGENVYPIEIEQLLYRHPNIKEVAIIGYPDEKWGESIKAIVALKDSGQPLSSTDVESFLHGKIARFKIPKQIEIVEALPRNATGKILKTVLRK